jgi:hypothetical protein
LGLPLSRDTAGRPSEEDFSGNKKAHHFCKAFLGLPLPRDTAGRPSDGDFSGNKKASHFCKAFFGAPLSSKTYNQNALNELKWMMKVGDGDFYK